MSVDRLRVMLLSQQPGIGGAERLAMGALSRSSELDVTVVAPPVQCEFASSLGLKSISLDLPRIRTPVVGVGRLGSMAIRVRRLAKALEAQIILANAIRAMGYGLAARLTGGPPLVAYNHHLLAEGDVTLIEGGLLNRRAFVWALNRWASRIIVPSEAAAAAFRERTKVRVVPNAVDLEHFFPPSDRGSAKTSLGIPSDKFVVGTVTRADPDKGMGTFLLVAKKLSRRMPQIHFILAGGPSFPHEESYYEWVKEEGQEMEDQLLLTGVVDDPKPMLQAMDVMVHLSELPETFGLTAAEAMACGVPVVGYKWGGLVDVVEDGVSGMLVAPKNVDAVVVATEQLLKDEFTRLEMGQGARETCEKRFDINRLSLDLTSILREVATE